MGLCEDDPSSDKTTMRLCLQVVPRHVRDIAASWAWHIVPSPSTSLCLFCNSCFELLIFSNQTSIKYLGATINTSKVHINNLYVKYTLVHFAILLIHQIFRTFPLPVTISFAVEALSFRLWSSFGLLRGSENLLAMHSTWSSLSFPLPFSWN